MRPDATDDSLTNPHRRAEARLAITMGLAESLMEDCRRAQRCWIEPSVVDCTGRPASG